MKPNIEITSKGPKGGHVFVWQISDLRLLCHIISKLGSKEEMTNEEGTNLLGVWLDLG